MTAKSLQGVKSTEQLRDYWVHGAGLKRWVDTPHPWTFLYQQLLRWLNPEEAKRTAAQWYFDALGRWPGDSKGKNPLGPG